MATDYKKNAEAAKKVVASLPKAQQAAARKVIAQAAKTGEGVSNNELAFLQANTSKLSAKTDPKAFLGTLEQRQTFLKSQQAGAGAGTTPEVSAEEAARLAAQEVENARLQTQRTDWSEYLSQVFNSYGLSALAPKIKEFVQQGFTPDTVTLKLQETPEYKQRFIGNENRRKAGLPVLTPGEYLSVESSYKKILKDAELPSGFYDQPDDFGKFIGADIAPTELQERVNIANQSLQNADKFYTDSLRTYYGLNSGDMLAYALDPERALPVITRQQKAAQFGAEAARQGIQVAAPMAERFTGQLGVTQQEARQGFEQVAQILPEAQRLGAITPGAQPVGLEETTTAVFGGESSADYKQRIRRLAEIEQSRFAGQAGVSRTSLAQGTQGQF
jgi:hypothetical protein